MTSEIPIEIVEYLQHPARHHDEMVQKYGRTYVDYQGCFAPFEMNKGERVPVLKFTEEPIMRAVDVVDDLAPFGIDDKSQIWKKERFLLHPSDYAILLSHLRDESLIEKGDSICPFVYKIEDNIFCWEDDGFTDPDYIFLIYVNGKYSVSANEELTQSFLSRTELRD